MPEQYDDEALARLMREGLHARAAEAADTLGGPVPTRSPRMPWLPALAAAAAVAVAVPVVVSLLDDRAGPAGRTPSVIDSGPAGVPDDWRVESYDGIQVRVPPDWGWGGAPFRAEWEGGEILDCGAAPFVVPGDPDYEQVPPESPYVGRPVVMTDVCSVVGLEGAPPRTPVESVWLGAPVEPGTEDLGGGWVRETVRLGEGDRTVTVTSDDPRLRAQIMATAELVPVDDHGCRADATWSDVPAGTIEDVEPRSLSVCLYDNYGGETTLVWSGRRSGDSARKYVEHVTRSSATYDPHRFCTEEPSGQWLAIGVNDADRTAWTAVPMSECAQILWHYRAQGDPESLSASPVDPDTVGPWAAPEVRAYVVGPNGWSDYAGEEGEGFFRGILG